MKAGGGSVSQKRNRIDSVFPDPEVQQSRLRISVTVSDFSYGFGFQFWLGSDSNGTRRRLERLFGFLEILTEPDDA
ncbi:hypothetical protein CDO73_05620 [Saccharibacillus sp. O23]|nr:hypothetical protein CDO73_05620 [Saccharibacillus sp. O23]